jgi:hypothetical protein
VVVVGAGITGLVTSYFLTRDPNNLVTLIEKSSVCPEESGFDIGVFNPGVIESHKITPFSFCRVDGPTTIYLSHLCKEPGVSKYLWHALLSWSKPDQNKLNGLSYSQLTNLV